MLEIRWKGRGGQGAYTSSKILGSAVVREGGYALSFPSFGPERRGAPMEAYTRLSPDPIVDRSEIEKCDFLVVLDETLFREEQLDLLKEKGTLLLNTATPAAYPEAVWTFDAGALAQKLLGKNTVNTALAACLAGRFGLAGPDSLKAALYDFLPQRIAAANEVLVEKAYEKAKKGR